MRSSSDPDGVNADSTIGCVTAAQPTQTDDLELTSESAGSQAHSMFWVQRDATDPVRRYKLFDPAFVETSASIRRSRSGESGSSASFTNITECGASVPRTVTTSQPAAPHISDIGGKGGCMFCFGETHRDLPGVTKQCHVDTPGFAPPMFIMRDATHVRCMRLLDARAPTHQTLMQCL